MGAGKIEVFWYPYESNKFISHGSELCLFRVRRLAPNEVTKTGVQRVNESSIAEILAVHSDQHYTRCVSCYCGKLGFPLLALGGANGRVSLQSFKQMGIDSPLVGMELVPRYARPCNCVAWSPSENYANLMAVGLDKHRNEAGLLIWDVAAKHQRSDGSSLRPTAEYGGGEGVNSLAWFPQTPKRLVAGANRAVKVYDMRDAGKTPTMYSQTKTVNGVCVDSFNEHRVAAFSESIISIWDTRSFEKPLITLNETKNVMRIAWSPTRGGLLASLSKESFTLALHDVQTSIVTDEPDLVALTRNIDCQRKNVNLAAFAWHPTDENRLLTVSSNGSLHDGVVFERMPVLMSSDLGIAWSTGKDVRYGKMEAWRPDHAPLVDLDALRRDISFKMRERVAAGYGLNPDPNQGVLFRNAGVVSDDPKLADVWRRLKEFTTVTESTALLSVARCDTKSRSHRVSPVSGADFHAGVSVVAGVKSALVFSEVTEVGQSCPRSTIEFVSWKGVNGGGHAPAYRGKGRSRGLRICGWEADRDSRAFEAFLLRLVVGGEFERAAAVALFNLDLKLAIDVLRVADAAYAATKDKPAGERFVLFDLSHAFASLKSNAKVTVSVPPDKSPGDTIKFCIMALSGFTQEKTGLWRDLCLSLYPQLSDPYLRALFAFLTADDVDDERSRALEDAVDLKLCDRVALALIYVPDGKLYDFIDKLTRSLVEAGDLSGLLLTGVSVEGLALLQNFVDATGDVQTACLLVFAAASPPAVRADSRVKRWCETYRSLLDQWRLWHQRAEFDVQRNLLDQNHDVVKKQVHIICNFCSKSVAATSSSSSSKGIRGGGAAGSSSGSSLSLKSCITSCSNCRKPLPRCVLCQVNMGTALPPSTPTFDQGADTVVSLPTEGAGDLRSWFTWCQSCRHGGHAHHVAEWFAGHSECPVTQCDCHCGATDGGLRAPLGS